MIMGKVYTSMRGKEIDMEKMSLKHELTPAVGNMRVNARGDLLGPGGQIVKTKEQIMDDYYKNQTQDAKNTVTKV
jgi:hypothetical protein